MAGQEKDAAHGMAESMDATNGDITRRARSVEPVTRERKEGMNKSIVAEAIIDELLERDWSIGRLVVSAGKTENPEYGITFLAIQMYLMLDETNMRLGDLVDDLAKGFGVSREFFVNLENEAIKRESVPVPLAGGKETGS